MKNPEQRLKEAIERADYRWEHFKSESDEEGKIHSWRDKWKKGKEEYLDLFRPTRQKVTKVEK